MTHANRMTPRIVKMTANSPAHARASIAELAAEIRSARFLAHIRMGMVINIKSALRMTDTRAKIPIVVMIPNTKYRERVIVAVDNVKIVNFDIFKTIL